MIDAGPFMAAARSVERAFQRLADEINAPERRIRELEAEVARLGVLVDQRTLERNAAEHDAVSRRAEADGQRRRAIRAENDLYSAQARLRVHESASARERELMEHVNRETNRRRAAEWKAFRLSRLGRGL